MTVKLGVILITKIFTIWSFVSYQGEASTINCLYM